MAARKELARRDGQPHQHNPAIEDSATNSRAHGITNIDRGQTFFKHIKDAAQITKKEWVFEMRVSDTIVDRWISGEQDDPFERSAKAIGLLLKKGRADLAHMALKRVAGGEELFDDALFARLQAVLQRKP